MSTKPDTIAAQPASRFRIGPSCSSFYLHLNPNADLSEIAYFDLGCLNHVTMIRIVTVRVGR